MKLTELALKKIAGKRVFVRADLNIPLENKLNIPQALRFRALLPTLDTLLSHDCGIVLATHCGRPQASSKGLFCERIDETLSTRNFLPSFELQGYEILFEQDLLKAQQVSEYLSGKILLLENLRFFKGEQSHDYDFAHLLASLADAYVNEAFSLLHRNDCSVTLLPEVFSAEKRFMGHLFSRECEQLDLFKKKKAHPYLLILGGKKIHDKLSWLEKIMHSDDDLLIPDQIALVGMMSLPFILVKNKALNLAESQHSLITEELLMRAQNIMLLCEKKERLLVLGHELLTENMLPEDTNQQALSSIITCINNAKKIVCVGTAGAYEKEPFAQGTIMLFKAIAESKAYTLVGGGDTIAALEQYGRPEAIDFISTGGGALLAYLAQKNPAQVYQPLKLITAGSL